jgi:DNA helicase II / ATP-dependent DNA helicase PcrA
MVLCRLTAPLVGLCLIYIAKGIKAYIKGRDIGENLIKLIEDTKKKKTHEIIFVLKENSKNLLKDIAKKKGCTLTEAEEDPKYTNYIDKIEVIKILSIDIRNSAFLISKIRDIFSNESLEGICLSTVHKAKGLEAENVYILNKDSFYLSRAMKVEWMAEQERNLVYVAITRAKHFLGYIELENKKSKKKTK